jgi:Uma2 family endonuclease
VIEIVSPESGPRDRGEKYYEYEAAGVREYWLIDPERQHAEFYRLNKQHRYDLISPDDQGIYRSHVIPGFWLKVGWLWQRPLPRVLDVLKELKLI